MNKESQKHITTVIRDELQKRCATSVEDAGLTRLVDLAEEALAETQS